MKEVITNNENETLQLAKKLAEELKGGEVIGLIGDLGAGKTVFAKGLAQGLGVRENVNSPTFVLMKLYKTKKHQIAKNYVHIDAYRLESQYDLEEIGVGDYLYKSDSIVLIEWADKVKKLFKEGTIFVRIENQGGQKRRIMIE